MFCITWWHLLIAFLVIVLLYELGMTWIFLGWRKRK